MKKVYMTNGHVVQWPAEDVGWCDGRHHRDHWSYSGDWLGLEGATWKLLDSKRRLGNFDSSLERYLENTVVFNSLNNRTYGGVD